MGVFDKFIGGAPNEQVFWDWFSENSGRLMQVQTGQERVCSELLSRLHRFDKHLTFVFGPTNDGRREFIVSAEGIASAFPAVRQLVDAAPEISGWNIIAFRPAGDLDFQIQLGDRRMDADDIWFSTVPEQEKVGLVLYIRDACPENEEALGSIAFLMLDQALGEYDVATRIGSITMTPLPTDPVGMGLKPLRELSGIVHRMTSGG